MADEPKFDKYEDTLAALALLRAQSNTSKQERIDALEKVSLRAIREYLIDAVPVATQAQYKLQDIDQEIAAIRATLTPEKTDGIDKDH